MLTELHGKGGCLCGPARQGQVRCPLIVRPTSEDVITGHIIQTLRILNPRWWLPDLLNRALGTERFAKQCYRRLKIEPWVNQPPYPRELLPYDEGSTQVDCVVTWENPPTTVFIEAKYGSDLSPGTTNSDGRHKFPGDQLIRNVRVGLQACGYFRDNALFAMAPRGFVCILLSPIKGHPLVERYRNESRLRSAIPYSERLIGLPRPPFIGGLDYADVTGVLRRCGRFMTRAERYAAGELTTYLEFKRSRLARREGNYRTPLPLLGDAPAGNP